MPKEGLIRMKPETPAEAYLQMQRLLQKEKLFVRFQHKGEGNKDTGFVVNDMAKAERVLRAKLGGNDRRIIT